MVASSRGALALAICSLFPFYHPDSRAAEDPVAPDQGVVPVALPPTVVTAKRLEQSRTKLDPDIGSSTYQFTSEDLKNLPLGIDTPLNQVILQAPGVVQDSFGQLHVRGDHANVQYQIDGVVVPEPITGFGQGLDVRFAQSVELLTGALPAQYGYRTAGVIAILSKGAAIDDGGSVSFLGGSFGLAQTGIEAFGTSGEWSAFIDSSYMRSNIGIENPTSSRNPLHDSTEQTKTFADIGRTLDSSSRITLLVGTSLGHFEIPDTPNQPALFSLAGAPTLASSTLNARQDEANDFQILTYQNSPNDELDMQFSVFHRTTSVHYMPDPIGDLEYLGVAATIGRELESSGLQGDASYQINDSHTVRAGYFLEHERFFSSNDSQVFPADATGAQTSDVPISISDDARLNGYTGGVYLQDEWKLAQNLTVNYGVRYDDTTTVTDEQQWSPRLGLVWAATATTQVHLGYARYFTPPPTETIGTTDIERFVGTTNQLPGNSDTSVKAERSNYFDAGVLEQLTPAWSIDFDSYYRRVNNLQDEGQFGNALIYSAFNYKEGEIGGVEFGTTYRQGAWTGYANVALSRAMGKDIITGQYNFSASELAYISNNWVHLDHDQTVTASAGLSYRVGNTTWSSDLLFGSGLRRGFANTEHEPAYTQVNLAAVENLKLESIGRIDLRVSVINLFDTVYELRDGSGIGVGAPQYGPRRGIDVGVTKYF